MLFRSQLLKVVEEFSNTSTRYRFGEENGKELIKIFFLPILLGIKVIDLKLYIDIINGNGYDKFFESINKLDVVKEGLNYYMNKDKEGKVSEESFKKQLLEMYNAIFNHKNDYKEYSNSQVTLDRYSYNYLMEILSLLRKGLKY